MRAHIHIALLFFFLSVPAIADAKPLDVGDPAPALLADDHLGRPLDLRSEASTGPVLLIFYRGHW